MKDRSEGREPNETRPIRIDINSNRYAEGSAVISMGHTKVSITVSVDERIPEWSRGGGKGWVTAEYSMLPRATHTRGRRESVRGHIGGRTNEIQRLIGRVLRNSVDLSLLGERTMIVDCDVLQADGGTRCAAINGAMVAVELACRRLIAEEKIARSPIGFRVAAVSVGRVDGADLLDLDYNEDSAADLDLNIILTEDGRLIEIQGGAEGVPFSEEELVRLVALARVGAERIFERQTDALKGLVDS